MSMSTTPVSSWKAAAARFAAQRSQAPAGPPPEDNPPLAAPIAHNGPVEESPTEGISLDPQPEAPAPSVSSEPEKPKARRGRPPGSKNKPQNPEPLLSDEALRDMLTAPLEPGVSSAIAMKYVTEIANSGRVEEEGAEALGNESAQAPAFRDFTLSEIAAAAKATGAEVTIFFSGKVA